MILLMHDRFRAAILNCRWVKPTLNLILVEVTIIGNFARNMSDSRLVSCRHSAITRGRSGRRWPSQCCTRSRTWTRLRRAWPGGDVQCSQSCWLGYPHTSTWPSKCGKQWSSNHPLTVSHHCRNRRGSRRASVNQLAPFQSWGWGWCWGSWLRRCSHSHSLFSPAAFWGLTVYTECPIRPTSVGYAVSTVTCLSPSSIESHWQSASCSDPQEDLCLLSTCGHERQC